MRRRKSGSWLTARLPAACRSACITCSANADPIDLVVSGPNYGRNTTAVFALSSARWAVRSRLPCAASRAIALSFAFLARGAHDPDAVADACTHAVRVVEALVRQWPTDGQRRPV